MMSDKQARKLSLWLLSACIVWVLSALLIYPVYEIFSTSFYKNGEFSTSALMRLWNSKRVNDSVINTLRISLYTIITVNIVGIFQVAVIDFFKVRGATILKFAFMTPLIYSSVALVTGYNFIYSSTGIITKLLVDVFPDMNRHWFRGEYAVLFVHTFSMTTMHILFLRAAIKKIDFSVVQAARSLGMGVIPTFIKIVLPVLSPTLFAVTLLTLLSSLSSFAAPEILGGKDFHMVNSIILLLSQIGRADMAALLALLLGLVSLVLLVLMRRIEDKGTYYSISKTTERLQKVEIPSKIANITVHIIAYTLFIVYIAPVALVIIFSFAPSESILTETFPTRFTLENYKTVLSGGHAFKPFLNSVNLSSISTLAGLIFAVICTNLIHKYKNVFAKGLEYILYLPWFMPSTMIAIGFIVAYDAPKALIFGNVLVGSYWILPIAMTISGLPFMVRMLGAGLRSMDPNLDDAAKSLGASPLYSFFKVTLPLMAPVIILVGALSFKSSLSDYNLSVMLYNVDNLPLGIALMNATTAVGDEQTAISLVYIVLMMIIASIITFLANHYGMDKNKH
ncbi:iron ABC transporter permease [Photobacterium sp. ZSDE20]|uniref:Iron ABC transporter permease n=1 Tax=Photobacterium pectinilyticum TaxID=2906793 RepID=A0ABT1MVW3_9GAMM|nr:iron ABC transporter permease [Photobacterium sp. ZSDE20]MCQ1056633.1 iron ABC transporter permease [Photobacterium sp. ZSDE20]MDD1820768.1 iron ABC transporter permease [Photobacterium sp. ZSDE20]